MIFALFSGFYANSNLITPVLAWIQWISPVRWAFSGFMSSLVSGLVFDCGNVDEGCINTGDIYLQTRGLADDSFGRSAGILIGIMLVLQLIGYFCLLFNTAKWVVPKTTTHHAASAV